MDIKHYMNDVGQRARAASRAMARADTAAKNQALTLIAAAIRRDAAVLRAANQQDLEAARAAGMEAAMLDRLTLSDQAIATMAEGLEQIVALADPIGEISGMKFRPSGIQVGQMRVPLGVIGIIYEARPNVTVDAAGLCIKSGNATILRGGSEAIHCNQALAKLVKEGLAGAGLPGDAVQIVETTDRAAVGELITMPQYVDVIVPRGGKGLIERLMRESKVPMIKHLDGICHVYIDDRADIAKALRVAFNAKCHRYGTCNTMETLLVAREIAPRVLPELAKLYEQKEVELRGDDEARGRLELTALGNYGDFDLPGPLIVWGNRALEEHTGYQLEELLLSTALSTVRLPFIHVGKLWNVLPHSTEVSKFFNTFRVCTSFISYLLAYDNSNYLHHFLFPSC